MVYCGPLAEERIRRLCVILDALPLLPKDR